MAYLFSARKRGTVVSRILFGSPGTISFLDGFPRHDSVIITDIGYRQSVNAQFLPSLADLIYVYVFGDKMGDVRISGLCFDMTCNDTSTRFQGVRRALSYYSQHRASVENKSVNVTIGRTEINGFLIDMNVQTANQEYKTMSFVLTLAALPRTAARTSLEKEAAEAAEEERAAEAEAEGRTTDIEDADTAIEDESPGADDWVDPEIVNAQPEPMDMAETFDTGWRAQSQRTVGSSVPEQAFESMNQDLLTRAV